MFISRGSLRGGTHLMVWTSKVSAWKFEQQRYVVPEGQKGARVPYFSLHLGRLGIRLQLWTPKLQRQDMKAERKARNA